MVDSYVPPGEPSPWLLGFEASLVERLENPFVENGLAPTNGVVSPPEIVLTPTSVGHSVRSIPEDDNITERRFFAIAARAYQEAVKFPEEPPPSLWAPGGGSCHSYYDAILYKFGICFHTILERQGRFEEQFFDAEWARHCRSIIDNIRSEWGTQPIGSMASIKTTINTPNAPFAVLALRYVTEKPTSPPPAGWTVGDPLHPYYEMMLARFDGYLRALLREHGMSLLHQPIDIQAAINQFTALILREYRGMWISMFGL